MDVKYYSLYESILNHDVIQFDRIIALTEDINQKTSFMIPFKSMMSHKVSMRPIDLAVGHEFLYAVEVLIKRGVELNFELNFSFTPLHYAVMKGNAVIVTILLKSGIDPNRKYSLNTKVSQYNFEKHGAFTINWSIINQKEPETAFFLAIKMGLDNICEIFLDRRYNVDINKRSTAPKTPMRMAIKNKNINMIEKILFHERYDFNIHDLDFAFKKRDVEILKILLSTRKYNLNEIWEITYGTVIDRFIYNYEGGKEDEMILEYLIQNFIDVNTKVMYYWRSLTTKESMLASFIAKDEYINTIPGCEILLKHGIDINLTDGKNRTALMWLCVKSELRAGNIETYVNFLQFLLNQPEIDVNIQDKEGFTALHYAAYSGNQFAAETLIKSGKINPFISNQKGEKALDIAGIMNHPEVYKIIIAYEFQQSSLPSSSN